MVDLGGTHALRCHVGGGVITTLSTLCSGNFCSILFPKYSSQRCLRNSLTIEWERRSVNPQPWRFTNNSLGLPHAPSFSVCLFLWVWVVCVCFLLYLLFYLCCVHCVFCVQLHIHNTYVTVLIDVRTTLPTCLSSFSICIFVSQISVCVCQHVYAFPSSFMFIHTNRHIQIYGLCPVLYFYP